MNSKNEENSEKWREKVKSKEEFWKSDWIVKNGENSEKWMNSKNGGIVKNEVNSSSE